MTTLQSNSGLVSGAGGARGPWAGDCNRSSSGKDALVCAGMSVRAMETPTWVV